MKNHGFGASGALRAGVFAVTAGLAVTVSLTTLIHAQQGRAGAAAAADNELHVLPVQGNVSMIVGAGGNMAAQIGPEGIILVDSGTAQNADKVIALLKQMAPGKSIRMIINTSADMDHVGGNEKLGPSGRRIAGGNEGAGAGAAAQIVAHENVLNRLSAPVGQQSLMSQVGWPTDTYFTKKMDFYINGESIVIENQPAAHSDGDSFVWFRKSDVVAAGELFNTTSFPVIDSKNGGSVNGVIDGLNRLLDITVPQEKQEGGTYVIPGHGRLCDEADVVEYRDMMTIIRDRFVDLIKKGKTLQEVKDMKAVADYEKRYGATTGSWTTDQFVETIYNDLSKKAAAPAGKPAAPAKAPAKKS